MGGWWLRRARADLRCRACPSQSPRHRARRRAHPTVYPLPPLSLPHWPHQWPRLLRHPARQRLPMARWLALAGEPWQQCWQMEKHWLMLVPVPMALAQWLRCWAAWRVLWAQRLHGQARQVWVRAMGLAQRLVQAWD